MGNPQRTYYYQEVESALHKFKEVVQAMLSSYSNLNIPSIDRLKEFANMVEQFKWSNLNSEANLNLAEEELTDEQKETIALKNKDALDETINAFGEIVSDWGAMAKRQSETNDALIALSKLSNEITIALMNYNYDELADSSCDAKPIRLTSEELFCALSFLTNEQVRLVLSEQTPSNFSELFTAYNKSKEEFIRIADEINIVPMYGLRWILKVAFESRSSYIDFMNGQLSKDILMWSSFIEDIAGSENSLLVSIAESLSMGEEIDGETYEFNDLLAASDQNVSNLFFALYYIEDIPENLKKKIAKIYDKWKQGNPALPDIESRKAGSSLSQRMNNISISLLDKWILSVIHEQMDYPHIESSLTVRGTTTANHLEFPDRFISETSPSQIYAQEREPILTEIFKVYGSSFENMSREEFLYLFGASSKTPSAYNPPYYWSGEESTLKAILKVFYTRQPRLLKHLILHSSDRATGATTHNWGKNKNRVSYRDIERTIGSIIQRLTGKKLKEL